MTRRNARNRKPRQGGEYTQYDFCCDGFGDPRTSRATSRTTTSRKNGCQWKGVALRTPEGWIFKNHPKLEHQSHNHTKSSDTSAHPQHRKLTEEELKIITTASKQPSIRPREIAAMVRQQISDSSITRRDVYNARAKIREKLYDGYTSVGMLIKILEEQKIPYKAQWADDDHDQLVGLVFVEPIMEDFICQFPKVLYVDMTYATNRFNHPFYQATTQTNIGTTAALCFGIINNEREEAFEFLFSQLQSGSGRSLVSRTPL